MLAGHLIRAGIRGRLVEHVADLVEDGQSVLSRGLRTVVGHLDLHVVLVVFVGLCDFVVVVVVVRESFQVDGAGRWRVVGIRDNRNAPRRVVSDGVADAFNHSSAWRTILQRHGSCARHVGIFPCADCPRLVLLDSLRGVTSSPRFEFPSST